MANLGVGKEVITHCSKCSLDLAHIIVAMKDSDTPHKVMCNTCKTTHSFKTVKAAGSTTAKKKATRKPRVTTEQKIINQWEAAMAKHDGETLAYNIRTKFEQGQIIAHPTFGDGVIDKNIDADKIEVIFNGTIKVLIHNK